MSSSPNQTPIPAFAPERPLDSAEPSVYILRTGLFLEICFAAAFGTLARCEGMGLCMVTGF